ncbi:hypothetical protein [Advenella kashmirensis]|uniref:hypothetical protein n=1 Tax=Advenella kashmirensis TaxID=310575 RepID=UPI00041D94A9|nr:hypothetical protein [Advenella kashmirensis]
MSIETQALETVYDHLAETLDSIPQAQQSLMLTRLALLMSEQIGQPDVICRLIDEAARNS